MGAFLSSFGIRIKIIMHVFLRFKQVLIFAVYTYYILMLLQVFDGLMVHCLLFNQPLFLYGY